MNIRNLSCDIAVIGAGPAGIAAALAAARNGASVLLVDRNGYLGGNLVSGLPLLGYLDKQGRRVTGGIAQELVDRLSSRGACLGHNRCPLHNSVTIIDAEQTKILAFEMCREENVRVLLPCELIGVNVVNRKLVQASVMGKGVRYDIRAKNFIDATGDGDAAFLAGASFEKGQEGSHVMQPPSLLCMLVGFDEEKFLAYLERHPEDLMPDQSMQVSPGYNVPFFRRHPGYVFLGLRGTLKELAEKGVKPLLRDTLIFIKTTHPGQICVNSTRVLNFDGSDPGDLTRGTQESLKQILDLHDLLRRYIPGFEHTYISSINNSIGVRETRRFSGLKRLTIGAVTGGEIPEDTVALGSYKVDVHSGTGSGTILTDLEGPYGIPMGCMISSEIDGLLLSGRCISMDALALASARVMPTCMADGQAAGTCAALSVRHGVPASRVDVREVIGVLKDSGAILTV